MGLLADLKYSVRSFLRAPALAAALLLTIAVGIGSNAAVLGFIRGLVGRDLPLTGIETIASVFSRDDHDAFGPMSLDDVQALRRETAAFSAVGAVRESQASFSMPGRASVASVATVTPEIADLLELPLSKGVVVSQRFWRTELQGRDDARGQSVRLDGVDFVVAGVAPAWLEGLYTGRAVDLWTPLDAAAASDRDRRSRSVWVLARLNPGLTAARAQTLVNAARGQEAAVAVQRYTGATPEVAGGFSRLGRLLPAAAAAVFFIACANVVAFLLARASARSQETTVRVALGASRLQLGRQILVDSLLIAVGGGACGLLLAAWTAGLIPALLFDQDAEHLAFAPDLAALLVVSTACVAVTVMCGLVPLIEVRHDEPATVLRRESGGPSNAMRRLRSGLVVAQMSCCGILVVATGVLLDGFRVALRTGAGDRLGEPIIAQLESGRGFDRQDLGREFFRQAKEAALALPGIDTAVFTSVVPGGRPSWTVYRIEPRRVAMRDAVATAVSVTPAAVGGLVLPPVAGRMFGGRDTPDGCRVVVVNEEAAADVLAGDAIGRAIVDPSGERVEIVGVVRTRPRAGTRRPPGPILYYYAEQGPPPGLSAGALHLRVPEAALTARGILAPSVVSSGYFEALGLSLVAGAVFGDVPAAKPCHRVGVVNQQAADLWFEDGAVGGTLIDSAGVRTEIIGVVQTALLRTSQRQAPPAIYLPMWQDFAARMVLILGARQADRPLVDTVARGLTAVTGGRTLSVLTLDEHLSRTALAPARIATLLVGIAAIFALALAGLGLFGALAESARQRRREIALRIALGAQSWRVIREVLLEGLRLAGAGIIGGAIGSLLVMRWLSRLAPGASAPSLMDWLVLPAVLVAAVLVASVVPARRALAVSPLSIMRDS